jgi:hypothetical protein
MGALPPRFMPIPDFNLDLALPPHLGNPIDAGQLSPYACTTEELCAKLGKTPERREILNGFLDFRERLVANEVTNGFHWLGGSILEEIEVLENRPPNDIDVATFYWPLDPGHNLRLAHNFPEFGDFQLSKHKFRVDSYAVDVSHSAGFTIHWVKYWVLLFSHRRDGVWKGMLHVAINTPDEDSRARGILSTATE